VELSQSLASIYQFNSEVYVGEKIAGGRSSSFCGPPENSDEAPLFCLCSAVRRLLVLFYLFGLWTGDSPLPFHPIKKINLPGSTCISWKRGRDRRSCFFTGWGILERLVRQPAGLRRHLPGGGHGFPASEFG
jgi:hypothetical protein